MEGVRLPSPEIKGCNFLKKFYYMLPKTFADFISDLE